jgi:hypothetical protein
MAQLDKEWNHMEWKAQLLRFTAFLAEPASERDFGHIWLGAIGTEADQVNLQPKRQLQVLQSTTQRFQMLLQVEGERIDFVLRAGEPKSPPGFVDIGHFHKVIDEFYEMVEQFLQTNDWPAAYRLAFGAGLFVETSDLATANQHVLELAPSIQIDPRANIRDLSFQINRVRVNEIDERSIRFNRLTKWSATDITEAVFRFSSGVPDVKKLHKYLTVLELDINTDADNTDPFTPELQRLLLSELIDLGVEISDKGDVE